MTGNLALDGLDTENIPAGAPVWEKVVRKVRAGMMPPTGAPKPPKGALDAMVAHLESTLDAAAAAKPELRNATLHRLNRARIRQRRARPLRRVGGRRVAAAAG